MEDYTIGAVGRQGDGIADGPLFVPRSLPGERVTGRREGDRLVDVKILDASPDRVAAPCAHFKQCGGCQLQHASDPFVAEWKQEQVSLALQSQGLSRDIRRISTSPSRSRRRAKLSARRTKSGAMAGFHGFRSDIIVDVGDCVLLSEGLAKAPEFARALARIGASRKGEMTLQCTQTDDGMDVSVAGGKPLDRGLLSDLPALAAQFGVVRLIWDGELVAQAAPPRHRVGQAEIVLPPAAFLQATAHGEGALQSCVLEAVEGCHSVADLFAGCGTFALRLAARGPVLAIEGVSAMTAALQEAANHAGLAYPVRTRTRDLFRDPLQPLELKGFDAVVLDPPRAGAAAQIETLCQSDVGVVAYVSCEPASFSRDAAQLVRAGFQMNWVDVVDQFRWSPHIELAAQFTRDRRART